MNILPGMEYAIIMKKNLPVGLNNSITSIILANITYTAE